MAVLKRRTIVSILIVMLVAYGVAAFLRECDLIEREWHALGDRSARAGGAGRWTDVNL
jgi:hypothetical protein